MSKYYDKLVAIDESLTRELNPGSGETVSTTTNEEKPTEVVSEENEDDTITLPKDALSDDQKKDILADKGVDQKTLDELKDPKELDGALDATLNNDEVETESGDDIDESVIIRMDDDDLDIHGYVKKFENGKVEWTDDEQEAEKFQHEELGQNKIEAICTKFHYDPSKFTTKSVDPRADEPYEESSLENDEETSNDDSDMVYIRLDDDDLEKHGYLSGIPDENEEPEWVDDERDAQKFYPGEVEDVMEFLGKFHYDPETITTQDCQSQVDDDGDNWITLDPGAPSATTLP